MNRAPASPTKAFILSVLASAVLVACGGQSGTASVNDNDTQANTALNLAFEPNAPVSVGDTATDGLAWFNYRRQQIGLPPLTRNPLLDRAAQAHSDYQKLNNVITHEETPGAPGFTGAELGQRIAAAGYNFSARRFAYGEVISATSSTLGFAAAEDLITAIYHRFVIFEPTFSEVGGGTASVSGGYTYFTANMTANGLTQSLGRGGFVTFPTPGQQHVPANFFSDREIPDPVPERNEVGFPISVHADIASVLNVTAFTVRPRGGALLDVKLLTHASDADTPMSTAALVPLAPLAPATIFDVHFSGTIDGVAVSRNWSFTTR
ncbi:MAG: hypothetical protein JWP36_2262 [Paucimonas sp.]|nr:hypothetical protein [Paucimonas sp.]